VAAAFTRYDGWILAFVVGVCAAALSLRWLAKRPDRIDVRRLRRSLASVLLLLALCPVLWLAHNYKLNGRPLDWLNGPYSARAIEQNRNGGRGSLYPGKRDPKVAALYFLKAARMNTGEGLCEGWLLWLAAVGLGVAVTQPRRFGAFVLLWLPLPFYVYSVSYGSVPIYVPAWWPFSYYNVRYGVELLPATAACVGLLPEAARQLSRRAPGKASAWLPAAVSGILLTAAVAAYGCSASGVSLHSQRGPWAGRWMIPVSYREAWVNGRGRSALETQAAKAISAIPPGATLLMYAGDHVGILQKAGVRFDRVVSEFCPRQWWPGLRMPALAADYVVAIDGDPVAEAVRLRPYGLDEIVVLQTEGQPRVLLYRARRGNSHAVAEF
jgi:hypothetical protein